MWVRVLEGKGEQFVGGVDTCCLTTARDTVYDETLRATNMGRPRRKDAKHSGLADSPGESRKVNEVQLYSS